MRQWRAGDDRRDYARLIDRSVRQQMDMIDELLEFTYSELAELEPEPVPGYLHAFLNEVADQAELMAEQRGNHLRRTFGSDLPGLVSVDFHHLRRVLMNLLGNAVKYNQRGDIGFAVTARPTANADAVMLHFSIDDSGPGIPAADRQRLLQPHARGQGAEHEQGYGLGLSIVTQLLARLGGQLQIGDAPGGGSRFHFELQVERATERDLEPVFEEDERVEIDGGGRVVLVVDDEPQQRAIVCDLLDGYGFDTVAAADGHDALQQLERRHVDLIITDQYMDGMDGWNLLQAARTRRPGLPVLLYSSVPPQRPVDRGGRHEFDGHLLKPAVGSALLGTITTLLATSGAAVSSA